MNRTSEHRRYRRADSVVFRKTSERFGGLSNMAPGYPLRINGTKILTSEALYQVFRFPHRPEVQRLIIDQNSPMTAKMKSKPFRKDSRPDWDVVRVAVMRWCLRVKLAQNWDSFSRLLLETGEKPIVEESHKDDFWGAKPVGNELLEGANVLGRLLMELRAVLLSSDSHRLKKIDHPTFSDAIIFGTPVLNGDSPMRDTSGIEQGSICLNTLVRGATIHERNDLDAELLLFGSRLNGIEVSNGMSCLHKSSDRTGPAIPRGFEDRQDMASSLRAISAFIGSDLGARIAELEWSVKGCTGPTCRNKGDEAGATSTLLTAAYEVKRAAGQINVLIQAVGGLLLLPKIMEPDEKIEYVSLGAGNSGREFDLETDRRVAEFKFIHWQGGAETIRQNALFKDFFLLAENNTAKRKELYVLGTSHPLRFFRGRRSLSSIMSRHPKLWGAFREKYEDRYSVVSDYYSAMENVVAIVDAAPLVPELVKVIAEGEADEEFTV